MSNGADSELALHEALQAVELFVTERRAIVTHDRLPRLNADQALITQLFQNLISNALKYKAETDPRIHVAAVQEHWDWVFSISDNGLGIPLEHRASIFGVFTRLHGREISGSGLGLAFCSKIVELHRGRIWAEGNPAEPSGSIFRFTLSA
jgi:light-regulated signal transduction histidine kinase (bacteriophytochrome)